MMKPTLQSWYSQIPGAYPVDEDEEEEELYLQMMNDIAEEEYNLGLLQSQYSQTSGLAGYQHQYAGQNVSPQRSSYQIYASGQQGNALKSSARQPSHQKPVNRLHPYIRTNQPTLRSNHQTSAYGSHQAMQTGPIRQGRKAPISHSSRYSRPYLSNEDAPAQQPFFMGGEARARLNRSAYEMCDPDFSRYRPMTAPISLEGDEIQASQKEVEVPRKSRGKGDEIHASQKKVEEPRKSKAKRTSQAQESNDGEKPAKPKAQCQTRLKKGRLECRIEYDTPDRKWEPAIRMDDCRRSLIDQQKDLAAHLGMKYRDPDPVGTGVDDETAFKPEHADWAPDREHLPEICWRFEEDEERNPRPSNNPGYMRFEGKVVLDSHDDPVKDWPQLPLTLSSKTRGYRLEIMARENPHIEYRDFLARMPSVIGKTKKYDNGNTETVFEAPDANAVCNMRMLRFRREKGLLSWTLKGNTRVIGEGLKKLFGYRLINNSMKSFGRDLTPQEQAEIRKGRDARFPETEQTAITTPAETNPRNNKDMAKTLLQPGNTGRQRASHQKRAREDDEDVDSGDDQILGQATAASYRKRRCNARGEAARPELDPDSYQDPAATADPQNIVKVTSSPTSEASSDFSDEYRDEDGDSSEDDDESDREYGISTSHRRIHPLPARHTCGKKEATNTPLPNSAQTQEQESGSTSETAESHSNETDHDKAGSNVTNNSDNDHGLDGKSDKDSQASSTKDDNQNKAVIVVQKIEEEPNLTPPAREETDLERHRRKTREFLGEQDDYYWLPGEPPPWKSTLFFPARAPE